MHRTTRTTTADGRINDGCPVNGTAEGADACVDHCPAKGHGIAVSAEIVGGSSNTYYGPIPPNRAPPADLTGATVCRSEGYYGTPWAGTAWRSHLDTMSTCGLQHELPGGASGGGLSAGRRLPDRRRTRLSAGEIVRLHSEYQNDTGAPQADVMGIMMAWLAPATPGYARPKAASPTNVRLVPAFNPCSGGNATHGAPLAQPSCNPPVQSSNYLTVGTPDTPGNGFPANSVGLATFKVVGESPINLDNGDQADVQVTGQLTDVRRKSQSGSDLHGPGPALDHRPHHRPLQRRGPGDRPGRSVQRDLQLHERDLQFRDELRRRRCRA